MKRVTTGVSRTVFLIGRWAVKVPCARYGWEFWLKGLLANITERRTWGWARNPKLCPIIFADPFGLVVVMPRVEVADSLCGMTMQRLASELGVEAKPDSFGYLSGRLVAIDYGN